MFDMPDGKRSGTKEEVAQYRAKHTAKIRFPKQQHVDAEKLRRGCCARCKQRLSGSGVARAASRRLRAVASTASELLGASRDKEGASVLVDEPEDGPPGAALDAALPKYQAPVLGRG